MACKFGIQLADCRSANDILIQIGFPSRLSCVDCHLNEASLHATQEYKHADTKGRKRVLRWFKKMGISTIGFETGPSFHTGFRCPILKETIVTPCALEKCVYHIDYPWGANCLLAYVHQQDVESLSAEEISYLYNIPIEYIRKMLDNAISSLRENAISHTDTNDGVDRQFDYLKMDTVCCVCESLIEDDDIPKSLYIESVGLAYCSKECKNQKHPMLIELEVKRGLPIETILDWTFSRYKSLALAEQALGIPRWLATESCHRYLDRDIEHYFPTIKKQRPRETRLIRRTWHPPVAIDQMIARRQSVRDTLSERYGTQMQFIGLRRQLNHLVQHL